MKAIVYNRYGGPDVLAFTDAPGLKRYALYVFDYGVPTGFRLALARPERVKRSFHRMAMLTKRGSVKGGIRSRNTGRNQPSTIGLHCVRFSPWRRPGGNIFTACRTRQW